MQCNRRARSPEGSFRTPPTFPYCSRSNTSVLDGSSLLPPTSFDTSSAATAGCELAVVRAFFDQKEAY